MRLSSRSCFRPCRSGPNSVCSFFTFGFRGVSRLLRLAKLELVQPHIDASTAKRDAFRFQPEPLLKGILPAQLDFSARAQNPVPGKSRRLMQCAHHLSRSARKSGGFGDGSVSGHLSTWHLAYGGDDPFVHSSFLGHAVPVCYTADSAKGDR
jgi:hypothetical protein